MSKSKASPFKRHPSRHRGISYRFKSDGSKSWLVYHAGSYLTCASEKDALALQGELRGKAGRGEQVARPAKVTFREVAESFMESKHRLRAGTRATYHATLDRILIPRFGDRKIAAITVDHVAALIRDLEKQGLAPSTIHAYVQPLRGVMEHAQRRRMVGANPCDQLTREDKPQPQERQEKHVWNDDEIDALIDAAEFRAKQPESRYDYSALIRVALFTGLRQGELLGLQWQDVDLTEGVLHVRRQWLRIGEYGPPKSKAGVRRVPLSADMVKYLAALKLRRADHKGDDDPVFVGKLGRPLGHRNVTRRGFEPTAELAGLNVSFHDMRHAFASRMIARGVEPVTLAKVMGHEDARITLSRYAHLFDRQKTDDAVRRAMSR